MSNSQTETIKCRDIRVSDRVAWIPGSAPVVVEDVAQDDGFTTIRYRDADVGEAWSMQFMSTAPIDRVMRDDTATGCQCVTNVPSHVCADNPEQTAP